jgi:hypothetical protein
MLHCQHVVNVGHRFKRLHRIVPRPFAQDFPLGFVLEIAHAYAHQKAIELRLGQRISAMVLDWILRSDY